MGTVEAVAKMFVNQAIMEGEKLDDALVLGFERALWAMLSDERLLRAWCCNAWGFVVGVRVSVNDTAGSAGAGVQMIVYTEGACLRV